MIDLNTTIIATATAPGGALSVIRLSGPDACRLVETVFSAPLQDRTAVFGKIRSDDGQILDEVLCTAFLAPRSYTGQQSVEISCHGSAYITSEIIRLLTAHGAVAAQPGEFTLRAFLGGKLDLAQAEAVADLIAADSRSAASVALQQMKGGYSEELTMLGAQLLHILSMLELELDFGEEDVEFADRSELRALVEQTMARVRELAASFRLGNVLKNGVPVAIVGRPNVGKSTLLNRLLGHERAIVSPIAGTTRDFIEETLVIDGITFRFIDTAGLRDSDDQIEQIGIERSYDKLRTASIVLHLIDSDDTFADKPLDLSAEQTLITVFTKCDLSASIHAEQVTALQPSIRISAKYDQGINELKSLLINSLNLEAFDPSSTIISNVRHHQALTDSIASFERALVCITTNAPSDLIAAEIRNSLAHLHEITGEITTDDILKNIFSKFCIGK